MGLVVSVLCLLGLPSPAAATEQVIVDGIHEIVNHIDRGGAFQISGVNCDAGADCDEWWGLEHDVVQNPANWEFSRQLRTLRIRGGVLPQLRALGTFGLSAGTFEVGLLIGSGIRKKILKIEIPQHTPWNPSWLQRLNFHGAGDYIYEGLEMPYDGFTWEWSAGEGYWRNFWVSPTGNGQADACPSSSNPPAIPPGLELTTGDPHPNCNSYWYGGGNGGIAYLASTPEDQLGARKPIEDYTGQSYDRDLCCWTGQPATRAELETRILSAFATGEYSYTEAWYAHQLEPENYPDPDATDGADHRCDVSAPSYKNRGGNESPDPYAVKRLATFPAAERPEDAEQAPNPYLRWGQATWVGPDRDNWPAGAGVTSRRSMDGARGKE